MEGLCNTHALLNSVQVMDAERQQWETDKTKP